MQTYNSDLGICLRNMPRGGHGAPLAGSVAEQHVGDATHSGRCAARAIIQRSYLRRGRGGQAAVGVQFHVIIPTLALVKEGQR